MYSRNLFVLDLVRRFLVSCAQIFEAYAVRTLMKFGCDWRKLSHKSKCKKDSESTQIYEEGNYDKFSYLFFYLSGTPTAFRIPVYLVWKKLWNNAAKKNEEYQQRYTGHTTLRVIRVEKNEWEETNSNEQGPESRISVTSYTPVYEYTVNGQRYEYHTRIGSSIDQYPIGI